MNATNIYNRYYWLTLNFLISENNSKDIQKYAYRRKKFKDIITTKYGFTQYSLNNFVGQIRKKARQDAENAI